VNTIAAGAKKITGKVELLDNETKIYAQIGKKAYEGTISKKGNFEIEIPKAKAGDKIKVWGTNKAGRGPLLQVVVEK
jgi:2',3'-cyclic-nucleotide 2'-phosphodiesterase/3'-nucleotidase